MFRPFCGLLILSVVLVWFVEDSSQANVLDLIRWGRKFVKTWKFDPNHLGLDPFEHIKNAGYPVEKHHVTTSDGYILAVHRIPNGVKEILFHNKPVILLQPGLLCTALCYLDVGPQRALAFYLADLGFDVWIGNARGSTFSRNHTELSPSKKAFWDFSWHEIGTRDLPAVIDYILETTNHTKLNYLGHSQGTTAFFVMASELPEYNEKIRAMFAFAPVAFFEHMDPDSYTYQLAKKMKLIKAYLKLNRVYEILPHFEPFSNKTAETCKGDTMAECVGIVDEILGYNPDMFDLADLPVITSHFPGGAALKQFDHYAQQINNGGFKKFDYGSRKNKEIYGQAEAPNYNLANINVPMFLFYGPRDTMSAEEDVKTLAKSLKNSEVIRISYELFNHGDFLWGKKVLELLYNQVFDLLLEHNADYLV